MTAPVPSQTPPRATAPPRATPGGMERPNGAWGFLLLDALALLLPLVVHLAVVLSGLPFALIRHYEAQTGDSGPQSYCQVGPWGTWIAGATVAAVLLVCALRLWRTRRLFWIPVIPALASLWWFGAIRSLFIFG